MALVFLISYSPRYQKPFNSFLIFTVDLALNSGEPGPKALAANLVSHFQLPSKPFISASSSGAGAGAGGVAGAAPADGAAVGGAATGALSAARATTDEPSSNAQAAMV